MSHLCPGILWTAPPYGPQRHHRCLSPTAPPTTQRRRKRERLESAVHSNYTKLCVQICGVTKQCCEFFNRLILNPFFQIFIFNPLFYFHFVKITKQFKFRYYWKSFRMLSKVFYTFAIPHRATAETDISVFFGNYSLPASPFEQSIQPANSCF